MSLEHGLFSSEVRRSETAPRTVVAGYDGSDLARAALALAGRRAGPQGRVIVVYAAPMLPEPLLGVPGPVPVRTSPEELGRRILGDVDPAGLGGAQVSTAVRVGSAARSLLDAARDEKADEIVVGSHGAGRLRALLGSTSHALVHEADRPVVVLTERAAAGTVGAGDPARLIVVGYDGSDDAAAALAYARRHLTADGKILAVHAYRAPGEWMGTSYYGAAVADRQQHGQRVLDAIAAAPEIETELIEGAPASALARLAASREADEIVVGSRGLGTLRAALGSVAHAVLHETDRPVVIVPRAH